MWYVYSVMNIATILHQFDGNSKGATFASFTYTAKSGRVVPETSRYTVGLRFNLKRIYQEDLHLLVNLASKLQGLELTACNELIASLRQSLEKGLGNNLAYTRKGTVHQTPIKGIRLVEQKDGSTNFEILGNVLQRKVLQAGVYKQVNSKEKTILKNRLRKQLQSAKIRCFSLKADTFKQIKMNGNVIEFE